MRTKKIDNASTDVIVPRLNYDLNSVQPKVYIELIPKVYWIFTQILIREKFVHYIKS